LQRARAVTRSQASHPVSLYDPRFEHDSCGTGFVARISGDASHEIVERALEALVRLEHRGAIAADGKSGDGAGVQTQLPKRLFVREAAQLGYRLATDDTFAATSNLNTQDPPARSQMFGDSVGYVTPMLLHEYP